MVAKSDLAQAIGNEPPILVGSHRIPDRRDVSLRWLSGTVLTGITSSLLMGVALFAALDGREQLASPGRIMPAMVSDPGEAGGVAKGGRLVAQKVATKPSDKTVMEISTVTRDGDQEIIRREPFAHLKISLAGEHSAQQSYPDFDPLAIFADGKTAPDPAPRAGVISRAGVIYGAQVDSEVSLKSQPFPVASAALSYASELGLDETEQIVRADTPMLTGGTVQVASLSATDPASADEGRSLPDPRAHGNAQVTTENVSVAPMDVADTGAFEFGDDVIAFRKEERISDALVAGGYDAAQAAPVVNALDERLGVSKLEQGDVLRIATQRSPDSTRIIRASIYSGGKHILTVARSDSGAFSGGREPHELDAVASAFDDTPVPTILRRDLPSVYDGLYQAGLSYGMSQTMIGQIVKLLSSSVDFKAPMKPTDSLEVFFSMPDDDGRATGQSDLLFVDANIDGKDVRFYRFDNPENRSVGYYDADGNNIRAFLLRKPVPGARFSSPFGMRHHPILGYDRMHWGSDWAAPRGTPIISVGDGVVEKAGWDSGGYGNQTIIRYGNGFESSFNHQSRIAKGVKPGAHVRQGQVIGYIGSTGLATGPHLHYEVIVNGTKVNPMKVRLPERKPLEGSTLVAFEHERKRIDALLGDGAGDREIASR